MIFNLGSKSASSTPPRFTYKAGTSSTATTYEFDENSQTSSVNGAYYFYRDALRWEFYMFSSGTLIMPNTAVCDVFLCGRGYNGASGSVSITSSIVGGQTWYLGHSCSGGDGGYGGKRKTIHRASISGTQVVKVNAASNVDVEFGNYKSSDSGYSQSSEGKNGGYSFDDENAKGPDGNSRLVGAGGGWGASCTDNAGGNPGNGGIYGGGRGGSASASSASGGLSGSFYGAGGGGGGAWVKTNYMSLDRSNVGESYGGGTGSLGFVAIRSAK